MQEPPEPPKPITLRRVGSWPSTPQFADLAHILSASLSKRFITIIWDGLRDMSATGHRTLDLAGAPAQIERVLNQQLYAAMQRRMDHALPATLIHEPFEFLTLATRGGSPPQPDLGFQLYED